MPRESPTGSELMSSKCPMCAPSDTIADVPTGIRPRLPHPARDPEELGTGPPPARCPGSRISPSHRQVYPRGAGGSGVLKVTRRFFAAHSRRTTETIANCSCVYFVVPAEAGTRGSWTSSLAPGPPRSRGRRDRLCNTAPGSWTKSAARLAHGAAQTGRRSWSATRHRGCARRWSGRSRHA
jgi:hypothetical protein